MRGIEKIIECRKAGKKPMSVAVWVGFDHVLPVPGQFDVIMPAPSASADFRPLVGLFVTVFAKTYSPAVFAMWDQMKRHIEFGTLKFADWDDAESVILFSKKRGQFSLAEGTN